MDDLDRAKFPPPDDVAMLPWYEGIFSHGFIALHPFFTVDGLDPRQCDYGTLILSGSDRPEDVDFLEWMDAQSEARRSGKEIPAASIADIAKRFGRRIEWRDICHDAGFADHCALDRALRTTIRGLRSEFEDRNAAEQLTKYCDQNNIFMPTEGAFQSTMEGAIVSLLQHAGLSEVIVGDEFGQDEKLISVASLADVTAFETRSDLSSWGAKRLMAPDRSMLVWVHWDSFYTALFGTSERLRNVRLVEGIEGFWCSDLSTTYWLMQDAIPLLERAN